MDATSDWIDNYGLHVIFLFLFLSGSVTNCDIFYPYADAGPVLFLVSNMIWKTWYEIQNKYAELVMLATLCLEGDSSLKWVEH